MRKMVAQKELFSLVRDLEVEEIFEDEEKEVKSLEKDCAGEEIVCGTQSLNELLVSIKIVKRMNMQISVLRLLLYFL